MAVKKTRLLKGICTEVVSDLIINNLKVKLPLWEAEGAALAKDIYEAAFSAELRATMEGLPLAAFQGNRNYYIQYRVGDRGNSSHVHYNGQVLEHKSMFDTLYDLWRSHENPTITRLMADNNIVVIGEDTELGARASAYRDSNYTKQINKVDDSIAQAARTLFSMKTLEEVQTAWPEIYPHLKAKIDAAVVPAARVPVQLPMVSTWQMNDVLGIPTELLVAA